VTGRSTRAERAAWPLGRDVVKAVALDYGACIRPVQLRKTNLDTGEVEQVLIPCGSTLARVCPPCAERARVLRAAQCREGWHLEEEPTADPHPPDDYQKWLIETLADLQADSDQAEAQGQDTTGLDYLIAAVEEELSATGVRGRPDPSSKNDGGSGLGGRKRSRRRRSTRRRQDVPGLPGRTMSPSTVGRVYPGPNGQLYRPSMFITLTCPSYGPVRDDGTPVDPDSYDYESAARDALHFAALFDRFIQNLRRSPGSTCSTSPPLNLSGGWPRTCTSRSAAPSPGPTSARCWLPPITRCGGPPPARSASMVTICRMSGIPFTNPFTNRTQKAPPMIGRGL